MVLAPAVTFRVPPSYTTPDPIENVATVSVTTPDPTPANNIAIARTSLAAPVADLSITKTNGATTIVPGTTTTYTIVVSNAGPSDAIGSTVTDAFAADFSSVTWTCLGSGGSCSAASGTGNINTTVNLPVGGTVTFTATAEVAPGAVGVIVNTANVEPPATADPTSASATDTDTLTPIADLVVTMTGSPAIALAGDELTYTITIANNGPSDAENVVLADHASRAVLESNAGDCVTAFPCQLGVLPSGTTRTVTSIFRIVGLRSRTDRQHGGGSRHDDGQRPGEQHRHGHHRPQSRRRCRTDQERAPAGCACPHTITVVVDARNHGPNPATDVVVIDRLPSGMQFVAASPSQGA